MLFEPEVWCVCCATACSPPLPNAAHPPARPCPAGLPRHAHHSLPPSLPRLLLLLRPAGRGHACRVLPAAGGWAAGGRGGQGGPPRASAWRHGAPLSHSAPFPFFVLTSLACSQCAGAARGHRTRRAGPVSCCSLAQQQKPTCVPAVDRRARGLVPSSSLWPLPRCAGDRSGWARAAISNMQSWPRDVSCALQAATRPAAPPPRTPTLTRRRPIACPSTQEVGPIADE